MDKSKRFKEVCEKYEVALAYLFGSRVEDGYALLMGERVFVDDPLADIDVGIVFRGELPKGLDIANLYSSIYNDLEEMYKPYPLDLVFLQETHSVFQANVISGRCVYAASREYQDDYEENVLRRAADFRPFLERYLNEMLEEV
jgi:uncharacterized protein